MNFMTDGYVFGTAAAAPGDENASGWIMNAEILSFQTYRRAFPEILDPTLRQRFEQVEDLEDR